MYVYCCDPCLDGKHDECEGGRDMPDGLVYEDEFFAGGGHCVCPHDKPPTEFQQHVIDKARERREVP
jgi:hypothetical protein